MHSKVLRVTCAKFNQVTQATLERIPFKVLPRKDSDSHTQKASRLYSGSYRRCGGGASLSITINLANLCANIRACVKPGVRDGTANPWNKEVLTGFYRVAFKCVFRDVVYPLLSPYQHLHTGQVDDYTGCRVANCFSIAKFWVFKKIT